MNSERSKIIQAALKIISILVDNSMSGTGKTMTVSELMKATQLDETEFDAADNYLLAKKYVEGTGGGEKGSRWITAAGIDFCDENSTIPAHSEKLSNEPVDKSDPKKVFVVHGRNEKARRAMFAFLRAIGLEPIEWSEAVRLTNKATPYIGDVLDVAFSHAKAVVILFTGDDLARLGTRYSTDNEIEPLKPQSRPNVLFEAGLAFGRNPNRTILVEIGSLREVSDLLGRHAIRMDNSPEKRNDLVHCSDHNFG